jgi:hypothetical protein
MKSLVNIEKIIIKNKRGAGMTSVIITFLVCCTIVTCCYLYCNKPELHTYYYATSESHPSGTEASGFSRPAESGKHSFGAGDCADPGDEESPSADGLP